MNERPIIFSAPMVRAILDGRKTQTRRVVKKIPCDCCADWMPSEMCNTTTEGWQTYGHSGKWWCSCCSGDFVRCPYGVPGDRLWLRETAIIAPKRWNDGIDCHLRDEEGFLRLVQYLSTQPNREGADQYNLKATPSIFMPRWASRITLEITGVRVEHLQDISEENAIAEGSQIPIEQLPKSCQQGCLTERTQFARIWNSINGKKHPWESNPFVWVIEFRRAA